MQNQPPQGGTNTEHHSTPRAPSDTHHENMEHGSIVDERSQPMPFGLALRRPLPRLQSTSSTAAEDAETVRSDQEFLRRVSIAAQQHPATLDAHARNFVSDNRKASHWLQKKKQAAYRRHMAKMKRREDQQQQYKRPTFKARVHNRFDMLDGLFFEVCDRTLDDAFITIAKTIPSQFQRLLMNNKHLPPWFDFYIFRASNDAEALCYEIEKRGAWPRRRTKFNPLATLFSPQDPHGHQLRKPRHHSGQSRTSRREHWLEAETHARRVAEMLRRFGREPRDRYRENGQRPLDEHWKGHLEIGGQQPTRHDPSTLVIQTRSTPSSPTSQAPGAVTPLSAPATYRPQTFKAQQATLKDTKDERDEPPQSAVSQISVFSDSSDEADLPEDEEPPTPRIVDRAEEDELAAPTATTAGASDPSGSAEIEDEDPILSHDGLRRGSIEQLLHEDSRGYAYAYRPMSPVLANGDDLVVPKADPNSWTRWSWQYRDGGRAPHFPRPFNNHPLRQSRSVDDLSPETSPKKSPTVNEVSPLYESATGRNWMGDDEDGDNSWFKEAVSSAASASATASASTPASSPETGRPQSRPSTHEDTDGDDVDQQGADEDDAEEKSDEDDDDDQDKDDKDDSDDQNDDDDDPPSGAIASGTNDNASSESNTPETAPDRDAANEEPQTDSNGDNVQEGDDHDFRSESHAPSSSMKPCPETAGSLETTNEQSPVSPTSSIGSVDSLSGVPVKHGIRDFFEHPERMYLMRHRYELARAHCDDNSPASRIVKSFTKEERDLYRAKMFAQMGEKKAAQASARRLAGEKQNAEDFIDSLQRHIAKITPMAESELARRDMVEHVQLPETVLAQIVPLMTDWINRNAEIGPGVLIEADLRTRFEGNVLTYNRLINSLGMDEFSFDAEQLAAELEPILLENNIISVEVFFAARGLRGYTAANINAVLSDLTSKLTRSLPLTNDDKLSLTPDPSPPSSPSSSTPDFAHQNDIESENHRLRALLATLQDNIESGRIPIGLAPSLAAQTPHFPPSPSPSSTNPSSPAQSSISIATTLRRVKDESDSKRAARWAAREKAIRRTQGFKDMMKKSEAKREEERMQDERVWEERERGYAKRFG